MIWHQDNESKVNISWERTLELWSHTSDIYLRALEELCLNFNRGRFGIEKNKQKAEYLMKKLINHCKWGGAFFRFTLSEVILDEDPPFEVEKAMVLDILYDSALYGAEGQKFLGFNRLLHSTEGSQDTNVIRALNLMESLISNFSNDSAPNLLELTSMELADRWLEGNIPGMDRDSEKACEVLQHAIDQIESQACMNKLAMLYKSGDYGIMQDISKAMKLLERAIESPADSRHNTEVSYAFLIILKEEHATTLSEMECVVDLCERQITSIQPFVTVSLAMWTRSTLAQHLLDGVGVKKVDAERAFHLLNECVTEYQEQDDFRNSCLSYLVTILVVAPLGVKRDESRAGTYLDEIDTLGEAEEAIEISLASSLLDGRDIHPEVGERWVVHIRP